MFESLESIWMHWETKREGRRCWGWGTNQQQKVDDALPNSTTNFRWRTKRYLRFSDTIEDQNQISLANGLPPRRRCTFCSGEHWNDECDQYPTVEKGMNTVKELTASLLELFSRWASFPSLQTNKETMLNWKQNHVGKFREVGTVPSMTNWWSPKRIQWLKKITTNKTQRLM